MLSLLRWAALPAGSRSLSLTLAASPSPTLPSSSLQALERIAGLLEEGGAGGLVLAERGDAEGVPRHPAFRLFGAMNPATDAGKRDLPAPLRNRFTELWIGEPPHVRTEAGRGRGVAPASSRTPSPNALFSLCLLLLQQRSDLAQIVGGYLAGVVAGAPVEAIVDFYLASKAEAVSTSVAPALPGCGLACLCTPRSHLSPTPPTPLYPPTRQPPQDATLQDGAGHKPAYNLRTLCRALEYTAAATPTYGLLRALWDGFAMSFLTQLDPGSGAKLERLMQQHLLGPGTSLKVLMRAPPAPPGPDYVQFDQFWVGTGGGALPAPGDGEALSRLLLLCLSPALPLASVLPMLLPMLLA